jgi:hypothetical protein
MSFPPFIVVIQIVRIELLYIVQNIDSFKQEIYEQNSEDNVWLEVQIDKFGVCRVPVRDLENV